MSWIWNKRWRRGCTFWSLNVHKAAVDAHERASHGICRSSAAEPQAFFDLPFVQPTNFHREPKTCPLTMHLTILSKIASRVQRRHGTG